MAVKKQNTETPPANRIIDIAKPGSLPPASATARPVIVSNRAVMQDPMMVPLGDILTPEVETPAPQPAQQTAKRVIRPLGEAPPTGKDKDSDGVVEDSEKPSQAVAVKKEAVDTKPTSEDRASITDPLGSAETDTDNSKQDEVSKAQEEIDRLIEEKTYFLPINSIEKRRSRHASILGLLLIIVLGAAWLNIALDAGLIKIGGLQPLTHFFSN
ncbi:MAG TPA: hypothetical protein VF572_04115 [Candidatus Saccharimonadales bacterium]|jgi:hypothetical protein